MTAERVPCWCGCGALLRRSRSFPLCKTASTRAWAVLDANRQGLNGTEWIRAGNRFWSSAEAVRAALAGAA